MKDKSALQAQVASLQKENQNLSRCNSALQAKVHVPDSVCTYVTIFIPRYVHDNVHLWRI